MTDNERSTDNSAKRLVRLLEEAIEIGNKNPNMLYVSAICKAENLTDNSLERAKVFATLFKLMDRVKDDLRFTTESTKEIHQKTISTIQNLIAEFYLTKFADLVNKALPLVDRNSPIIDLLKICARDLGNSTMLKEIKEEELIEISNCIDNLIGVILESDIDEELKNLLHQKLEQLKEVIKNYQFEGSDGIKIAIENIIGSLVINHTTKEKNEEEKNLVNKVFELVCKLLSAASAVKNLLPEDLIHNAQKLLTSGQ